ncbi:bifunctional biotin--[acetyl-CoA-carboxylase] ligase/biotin operon repressor BirA [Balneatrix alpica]|uniref:Bifunctional ligase/repressor BirA n=1 Tax=Balneatrix alpica TaxID=75684 RepID=A0ABV5ZHX2_9GAMM|nr:bifunctional biotin--[acetyl-CoA-carboxylase] ligase/biotin operon repressor BirA [Balneatrix alpica]
MSELQFKLVQLLAGGRWCSGAWLGRELGVSRTAVWKHLQGLAEWGLDLHAVQGKGYRLAHAIELIDMDALPQWLQPELQSRLRPEYYLSLDSTNRLALERTQQADAGGVLIIAEHQRQGRGRRGRQWISPFAQNIYLSLVWEFETGPGSLEGLSLVVGLALAQALERLGVEGVALKWPNDVWVQGRKVAGILLELNAEASGRCQVVIGVGINVDMHSEDAASIDQPWCSLRPYLPTDVGRTQLLAALLNRLVPLLEAFQLGGFAPLREEWLKYGLWLNQAVSLTSGAQQIDGVLTGIDLGGGLELQTAQGRQVFYGGEVSVRAKLTP